MGKIFMVDNKASKLFVKMSTPGGAYETIFGYIMLQGEQPPNILVCNAPGGAAKCNLQHQPINSN
jgi:hypothetical protein